MYRSELPYMERSIVFVTQMVQAILWGWKTQTRRVVMPQWPDEAEIVEMLKVDHEGYEVIGHSGRWWNAVTTDGIVKCPYGPPGTILRVGETWATHKDYDHLKPVELPLERGSEQLWWAADDEPKPEWAGRTRSARFLPMRLRRIALLNKSVRVQRIQNITPTDAQAEGDKERSGHPEFYSRGAMCHVDWFRDLWDSINKKRGYGWDMNPRVWAIKFERVEPVIGSGPKAERGY
jgi:hypothetical protein